MATTAMASATRAGPEPASCSPNASTRIAAAATGSMMLSIGSEAARGNQPLIRLAEETLRAANAAIVNAHHRHDLAAAQGGGTISSDGLRMPMRGKSLTGRAPTGP